MVARELLDPDATLWQWIAYDLHFYRTKHDQTLAEVGRHIGLTRGAVSNLEAARPGFRLQDGQAAKLDKLWGLNGHFGRLLRYARRGHDPEWFKNFTDLERRATTIKEFALAVVPGLLQTADYARALMTSGRVADIDAAVEFRMARQRILDRPDPPELWALLTESVLDQPVGGPEVMCEQLTRLHEFSLRPNIVLRVVPRSVGAHMGLDGAFIMLSAPDRRAAYMEAVGGGRLSDDPAEVNRYAIRFDRIGADALSREASRQLIKSIMETLR